MEGDSVQFTLKEGKLPSGLTLSSTTGVISGTPTEGSRTANVTVEGSNTVGSYHVSLLFIPISPPSIKYSEDSYTVKEGVKAEIKPEVKYVLNVYLRSGSIPEGMELSATDGTISGIPSDIGTTKALIAAENQDGTMTATVIIEVSENIPIPERIRTIIEYILIVIGILVVLCCCCCYCMHRRATTVEPPRRFSLLFIFHQASLIGKEW